jgi:hypothetical protein
LDDIGIDVVVALPLTSCAAAEPAAHNAIAASAAHVTRLLFSMESLLEFILLKTARRYRRFR